MLGDHACAEGALAAGCRFFAGYPITPATEVAERMAERLPEVGGLYIQMEDEIASIAAILGASWAGAKSMTSTSGPGFSLMMENLGLGIITETPTVIVNVQRAGPSTGLPTLVGQGDMMQARWGSHGPYEIIALVPWSAQECFDLTVRAFNLAEEFRTPVLVMTDAEVGHLTEKVVIPPADQIPIVNRKTPTEPPERYRVKSWDEELIPPMPKAGDGYRVFVESLTHDERGYPVMHWTAQERLVRRLIKKIQANRERILDWKERDIEGAEVVVLSYGISARVATRAIAQAQEKGIKVGSFRLITAWPFPVERVREIAGKIKGFVVPEINYGQMVLEVERAAAGQCRVLLVPCAGGRMHEPEAILEAIVAVAEGRPYDPFEAASAWLSAKPVKGRED
ncbi:MAG: 2-oxoacid:acceptor oxidoreductase subunit alpha [Armatimonadetes bacterium]|nr:2-oxoacid:acceptor oxidoreductase subunit alpha [Armatimonadota bacterium]MDW8122332.1 2-oxoacid:acceptor oxidoreductase subunit alpha [Armatimonadota bacterium]